MYFITTKRMLEVCFSAHPNIQYRTNKVNSKTDNKTDNKTDGIRAGKQAADILMRGIGGLKIFWRFLFKFFL